jgi:hypothetical protein
MPQVHRGAFGLFLALLVPAAAQALPPIPGGILDTTGRVAYLTGSAGIDAISLAHGELVWRTTEAQYPLLVVGDRLYALAITDANLLQVKGFDLVNQGKRIYQSAMVDLPRWVVPRQGPERSFTWTWRREKTTLILNWTASASSGLGPRKQAAAVVRIDLEDGKVKSGPVTPPPAPTTPHLPPQLEKRAVRWQRSLSGQLHALLLEEIRTAGTQRKQRLVLRTWNERSGKEGSEHELLRGTRLVVMEGLDGIHLWVRDAAPSPDVLGSDDVPAPYHWMVYSALDGHLVARVPFVPGTREVLLLHDRAYCLAAAPLRSDSLELSTRRAYTLHAIDTETGKVVWKRMVRVTAEQRP